MFSYILRSLALRILDKELRENWIHRAYFNDYTKWMSRDFPVMEDVCQHFRDRPYGQASGSRHREEMRRKYFLDAKELNDLARPDFVPAPPLTPLK